MDIFDISAPDLINLRKWYKKAPKEFTRAAANVLNSQARTSRAQSHRIIKEEMHVRAPKFVEKTLSVTYARVSKGLNNLVSEMGSLERDRFSGWVEQETGKPDRRDSKPTTQARIGQDIDRRVSRPLRMDRSDTFYTEKDFPGKTKQARTVAMLSAMRKGKPKKRLPFIIPKGLGGKLSGIQSGVYQYQKKKLNMVQTFEPRSRKVARVRWLSDGVRKAMQKYPPQKLWEDEIKYILSRRR